MLSSDGEGDSISGDVHFKQIKVDLLMHANLMLLYQSYHL